MAAVLITLRHLSISSQMNLPKLANELANDVAPNSTIWALIFGQRALH